MLRRTVDYLVMPIGLSITLALAALVLFIIVRNRKGPWGKRAAWSLGALAVLILYVASIRPTADLLTAWAERSYEVRPVETMEPVDAVMVLGGATVVSRRRSGEVYLQPGPRFEAAMELFQAGRVGTIVLSGCGSQIPGDPRREGDHLRDEALRRGVDASRLVISPFVQTTGDETRVLAEIAKERGWTRVAIATEAGHMWRAIPMAKACGLDAIPFTTDQQPPLPAQPPLLRWLPNAQCLQRSTRAWHEILGRLAS